MIPGFDIKFCSGGRGGCVVLILVLLKINGKNQSKAAIKYFSGMWTNLTYCVTYRVHVPPFFDWGGGGGNSMFVPPHFEPRIFIFHLNYMFI